MGEPEPCRPSVRAALSQRKTDVNAATLARVILRRLAPVMLLAAAFAGPAHAQPTTLMPGVTFEKTVEFTPNGAVVVDVITAPRPGGLYALTPALAHGTVAGGLEPVTQIEQDVSAQATVAGIDGDSTDAKSGTPSGLVLQGGALWHPPVGTRSSTGVDAAGALHVDRVRFSGTWQGTGQRRPLAGVNQPPDPGSVVLYTPAWGAPVPAVAGSAEVVLQQFPAAAPNTVVSAPVTSIGAGGGETIPPAGAVLLATGASAAKLQAEVPVGATLAIRLALQPSWDGVATALGGGPVLVRNGKAVFRNGESFASDLLSARAPRAAVGQLADGRILLVAVDGSQPGYSVGLTTFELARTMTQLGAVTASAVDSGSSVAAAFDGQLLDRPYRPRPVKEALLVEYFGVYAPPPSLPLVNGDPGRTAEQLSYKVVRPSTVTAELVGPDGTAHVLEQGVQHVPGTYQFGYTTFDTEGTWHWNVVATDDLGRQSTADRTFRFDTTLQGLAAPRVARGSAAIRFRLTRGAVVKAQIETQGGVVIATLSNASLPAGDQTLTWDGTLPQGTRAYAGTYVAHVFATTATGTSDLSTQFSYRRG